MGIKCGFDTSLGRSCSNRVEREGDACYIHKAKKLEQLNGMFRKELATLHSKLRDYSQKLADSKKEYRETREKLEFIDRVDLMKQKLLELAQGRSLVKLLRDRELKREIEEIVGIDFYRAKPYFYDLLQKRNYLCHPHTMADYWSH